tara:strand:+ start:4400 stop:6103 length:1704 start_codon:yes stop_codon:yes gene_type:complete
MDRRTLLAFGLIGVIIFAMPYYFRWLNGEPLSPNPTDFGTNPDLTAPTQLAQPETRASTPSLRSDPRPPQATQPPTIEQIETQVTSFEAQEVLVETDLYAAVFTTRGGRVTSWRLKEHLDGAGNPLELVEPGSAGLGLWVAGQDLTDVEFVPSLTTLALSGSEQGEITFSGNSPRGPVVTRVVFQGNRYRVEYSLSAEGLATGEKIRLGWDTFPAETEGETEESGGFYAFDYDQVVTSAGGEVESWTRESLADLEQSRPSGRISWFSIRGKYFLSAIIPVHDLLYDLELHDPEGLPSRQVAAIQFQSPGEPVSFGLYIGPLSYRILTQQDTDLFGQSRDIGLDDMVQFGWAFLRPILKPATILIIHAFSALHNAIPNYGFVIVVFSVLVKIVLFPLTRKSTEATGKMQELQPQITALREKHGDNQQKMNQEMMKLYKDQKVNPLGGCLPLFLQAPILFSLFNVFRNAIELRQAGFIWWMTDLSKPDTLTVAGFDLHILPLVMAGSMFVQQKLTMKDPKQAALVYIMPVFMIWIFWSMSSGLVLYFTMYNLLSVIEQKAVKKTVPQAA